MLKKNDKTNDLDTRQKIYHYIKKNPGMHFRNLSRKLNIPKTTLSYHIRILKKQDLISIKSVGSYKRIYIIDELSKKERMLLNLLRQEVPCKILLYLLNFLICSQIELSRELQKSPATIEFHLRKLVEMDIIQPAIIENGLIRRRRESCYIVGRSPIKSEIIYTFKGDDTYLLIHILIVKYGKSFPDQKIISDNLKICSEADISRDLPKKIKHHKGALEDVFEVIYEILPHPYHA